MVNVLQRKIGMNFKRVTSVPASNASSASEDAAVGRFFCCAVMCDVLG